MLVLSRKVGESIRIGDDITVVVVDVRGDRIRLGIEAPKEVPVHRGEVHRAMQETGGVKSLAKSDTPESHAHRPFGSPN